MESREKAINQARAAREAVDNAEEPFLAHRVQWFIIVRLGTAIVHALLAIADATKEAKRK